AAGELLGAERRQSKGKVVFVHERPVGETPHERRGVEVLHSGDAQTAHGSNENANPNITRGAGLPGGWRWTRATAENRFIQRRWCGQNRGVGWFPRDRASGQRLTRLLGPDDSSEWATNRWEPSFVTSHNAVSG